MSLFGRLLHQLHHQLVRLAHHRCAVHAYQLISGPQASVLVRCSVFHYVADVDLRDNQSGRVTFVRLCAQTSGMGEELSTFIHEKSSKIAISITDEHINNYEKGSKEGCYFPQ